jgi:Tfp pilus assembly protein PilN
MDKQFEAPKGRLMPTIVIFVFALALLYTFFLLFQQYSLNRNIEKVNEQIVAVNAEITALKSDQIEQLYSAKQVVEAVEADSVYWSQVIKKIQNLTPVTVFFSSYSGSGDGSLQLSGLGDSFGSVADAISSLSESPDFVDVFVPSVTLGSTSEGQQVVSFSLQVKSDL